jgi:hypothetical protein
MAPPAPAGGDRIHHMHIRHLHHMHIRLYIYIKCIYACACKVRRRACTHMYARACMYTRTPVQRNARLHAYARLCACAWSRPHAYIYTYRGSIGAVNLYSRLCACAWSRPHAYIYTV